ncbi:hypothetical protein RND71_038201 [Anisodus tanguticus]|uniref:X8 domain-containing protein n=1 Tax=Anisodus tanguticus TaxID=243964 RepID=A0AAE1UZ95_9SOLA|nr:hypothetical protein RND71_038201 [Anisodus tanguticus]
MVSSVNGIGANWGTPSTHNLPPEIVVKMLKDNGFQKVKIFDADYDTLRLWEILGLKLWYVAVGNEPFLETYNGSYLRTTFPDLQNVQTALIKAGHGNQVKVTVPLNADVYESACSLPSGGDFRADIHGFVIQIVKFLSDNGFPFTINIYPFISLYIDSNFPVEYAFFDGNATPLNNGGTIYTNMFDRFNQGFMAHISDGKGTPMRPGPVDVYLFSLIDEDSKSIQPGNFERHWGIFAYDGRPKYSLSLGTTNFGSLVPASNVKYLERKRCVLKPDAKLDDPQVVPSVSYACALADCTSLGYETSCGGLDTRGNISYAFNSYYQINNQLDEACKFSDLGTITKSDPSTPNCRFGIMIEPYYGGAEQIFGCTRMAVALILFPMMLCSSFLSYIICLEIVGDPAM